AAFLSVTVTRVRILRLSLRIRSFFRDSLTLSLTLPLAGTLNDFLASVTRFFFLLLRLRRTFLTLLKTAVPVSPGVAWKLNLNLPLRSTLIEDFVPAKLALAGGAGGAGAVLKILSAPRVVPGWLV